MYHNLIFKPLYNGLVGIMDLLPWVDIGVAVIIFTIIVKLALFHLSKVSLLTQIRMKEIEPETNRLREQYSEDRQTQALKIMELYRAKKIKPFSGILLLLIQLPILFALLSVFYKVIPEVNPEYLYSFVSAPEVKTMFLGLIDLTKTSLFLAVLTGIAQYVQIHFSIASKSMPAVKTGNSQNPQLDFAASMNKQMKIMMPLLAFASIYWIIPRAFPEAASIIALYWMVSSLFTLAQEIYIRKQYEANKIA